MDASQAVGYVRVHHQLYPNRVDADKILLPPGVLDGLRERRHNVTSAFDAVADILRPCPRRFPPDVPCLEWDPTRPFAVAQTVVKKDGKIYGALRFCVPRGILTQPNSGERKNRFAAGY